MSDNEHFTTGSEPEAAKRDKISKMPLSARDISRDVVNAISCRKYLILTPLVFLAFGWILSSDSLLVVAYLPITITSATINLPFTTHPPGKSPSSCELHHD